METLLNRETGRGSARMLALTGLFAAAWGGNAVLEPFYREYRDSLSVPEKKGRKEKARKGDGA